MKNSLTALCLVGVAAGILVLHGCACGRTGTANKGPAWDNSEAVADQNNTSSGLTAGATSNNGMLDIY
jgi:hypothetical protein